MAHFEQIGLAAIVGAALAAACTRSGESGAEVGRAATDSAALAASATPAEFRVSNVMIGRQIGPGNRITEPTTDFAPQDTVYVSVATVGGGGGSVTAAWRSQSGEILEQRSQRAMPEGENTEFHLSPPKGLKPGTYKVIVFLDDDSVDTKVFAVRNRPGGDRPRP